MKHFKWLTKAQEQIARETASKVQSELKCGFVNYKVNIYGDDTEPDYIWSIDIGPISIFLNMGFDASPDSIVDAVRQQIKSNPHMNYWVSSDGSRGSFGQPYFDESA